MICTHYFIAYSKSANWGLPHGLPDAMEGPKVLLIHAATMVTAGATARCSHLFEYSPTALNLVSFKLVWQAFFLLQPLVYFKMT